VRRIGRSALLAVVVLAACGSPPDRAVAAAARRAMEAYETALVPPAGTACPPDQASWPAVQRSATERISSAFADPERTRLLEELLAGPTIPCVLGGGVFAFEPSASSIDGDRATLAAEVGTWSRFALPGRQPLEPRGREQCSFELVRHGAGWLVSDYRCSAYPQASIRVAADRGAYDRRAGTTSLFVAGALLGSDSAITASEPASEPRTSNARPVRRSSTLDG
jgi:hypothetical protein